MDTTKPPVLMQKIPRVLVASPSSSSGKTTLVCALLRLLQSRGKKPAAFKCGPDFIDPLFHERVLGVPCTNLDSYFLDAAGVRSVLAENVGRAGAACAVIEGAMGFFDGLAGTSLDASAHDIARITRTPVLLVIDGSGMSRSVVALVKGFLDYDRQVSESGESLIKGIFLNKVSKPSFLLQKKLIEDELSVPVVGFLPDDSERVLKSRHLGLVLPSEVADLGARIGRTAELLAETTDFPLIEAIMDGAEPLPLTNDCFSKRGISRPSEPLSALRIAVARDEAFCFYYQENLRLLEEAGAVLEYFSPLHDSAVPGGAGGIIIGGGYPELHAARLEANVSMRESVRSAVRNGVSVMAECGGFMYLQKKLIGGGEAASERGGGRPFEMCGVIDGECRFAGKLVRFGYSEFTRKSDWRGGPLSIKGHEFHYFDSTNNGCAFTARKPLSSRSWDCMVHTEKMLAGFPHLYYRSNPEIARLFVESCRKG